jgi:hypothetical protein
MAKKRLRNAVFYRLRQNFNVLMGTSGLFDQLRGYQIPDFAGVVGDLGLTKKTKLMT